LLKSLIKPKKDQAQAEQQACCPPAQDEKIAQCCAKHSKLVAGCHD